MADPEVIHRCKESVDQKTYYDGCFGGQVEIVRDSAGEWGCGNDDAGLRSIAFCPYCGMNLKPNRPSPWCYCDKVQGPLPHVRVPVCGDNQITAFQRLSGEVP